MLTDLSWQSLHHVDMLLRRVLTKGGVHCSGRDRAWPGGWAPLLALLSSPCAGLSHSDTNFIPLWSSSLSKSQEVIKYEEMQTRFPIPRPWEQLGMCMHVGLTGDLFCPSPPLGLGIDVQPVLPQSTGTSLAYKSGVFWYWSLSYWSWLLISTALQTPKEIHLLWSFSSYDTPSKLTFL